MGVIRTAAATVVGIALVVGGAGAAQAAVVSVKDKAGDQQRMHDKGHGKHGDHRGGSSSGKGKVADARRLTVKNEDDFIRAKVTFSELNKWNVDLLAVELTGPGGDSHKRDGIAATKNGGGGHGWSKSVTLVATRDADGIRYKVKDGKKTLCSADGEWDSGDDGSITVTVDRSCVRAKVGGGKVKASAWVVNNDWVDSAKSTGWISKG